MYSNQLQNKLLIHLFLFIFSRANLFLVYIVHFLLVKTSLNFSFHFRLFQKIFEKDAATFGLLDKYAN